MTRKNILHLSIIMGFILYGAWIALSLGIIVTSQSTIIMLALMHLVGLMFIIEDTNMEELQESSKNWVNYVTNGLSIIMFAVLIMGKLVFWWLFILFYILITTYIYTRRPDLLKLR